MKKELSISIFSHEKQNYEHSYEANEYPLKNGYHAKAAKNINSILLLSKDTYSYLSICPFACRIKNWLNIWKKELETIRKLFTTKIYKQYAHSIDFNIGVCDKDMYKYPKYIGWKYIHIIFNYDNAYNTLTEELQLAMTKKHIYIHNDCAEPKYIFFYKSLTKRAFIKTFDVCNLLFNASTELNRRQAKVAKNYLNKQKLWTKL